MIEGGVKRSVITAVLAVFGTWGAFVLALLIALEIGESANSPPLGFVSFVISLFFLIVFLKKMLEKMLVVGRKSIKEWLVSVERFKYK